MGGPTTCLMGVLMGVVLPPTWCFQLQVTPQRILELPGTPSFGYGVLALQGGRVVVGAPAVGRLYGCGAQSGECTELQLGGNRSAAHMGMALSRHGNNTIACGPGLHMECNQNVHVGGVCAVLDPQLQPIELMEPGLQGCVPGAVDLVFLFDGSGSLSSEQFDAILDFMRDAMEQLHNSSFQFAAVQFSDSPLPLFSFRDYSQRPQPRELLRNVEQLGGLTDTFQAIDYVVDHMFSPGSGSRPWARHVILIVTDGDATDSGTVSSAERRGILRYVIGVGRNFRSARSRALLELLASSPSEHFVTVLDEFERLRGIFSQLQQRIYNIEGTSAQHRFHLELSSAGISAASVNGRVLTGAVGADNGAGGLLQILPPPETFVANNNRGDDEDNAYMGYAMAAMSWASSTMLAVGAPRRRHVGGVEIMEGGGRGWNRTHSVHGEQLGSQFGSALLWLLVSGSGSGSFPVPVLLVGAPLHYDGRRGGRVHVYQWEQGRLESMGQLWGSVGQPLGRFGSALSVLGDPDGGGTEQRLVVGAPMEDGGTGAVYVCRVGKELGCIQRIEGRVLSMGLRHFGTALDGTHDLNGDGGPDVAVGAMGQALIFSSRPVVSVSAILSVPVRRLPHSWGRCEAGGAAVGLRLCFQTELSSNTYRGRLLVPIHFLFRVDSQRHWPRGQFTSGSTTWEDRMLLEGGERCVNNTVLLQPCPEDSLTPMRLAVNYSLDPEYPTDPTDDPIAVIDPITNSAWIEVPYEQRCGSAGLCDPDVSLSARAPPGGAVFLGGPEVTAAILVPLELKNQGGDGPGVTVNFRNPAGSAFRRATASMGSTPVPVDCREGAEGGTLRCHVGHPVFRADSTVLLELSLELNQNQSWGGEISMWVNVSSPTESRLTVSDNSLLWSAPVRYRVGAAVTWLEDSTPYLSFTPGQTHNSTLRHHYQVQILLPPPPGAPQLNLSSFLLLPHKLPHGMEWSPSVTMDNGAECQELRGQKDVGPLWGLEKGCIPPQPPLLFRCPMGSHLGGRVTLSANITPPTQGQPPFRSHLCSRLWFRFGSGLFQHHPQGGDNGMQGSTEVELLPPPPPLLLMYVGGAAGGVMLLLLLGVLLFKCGFFRRGYRKRMEGEEGKDPDVAEWEEGEGEEPDVAEVKDPDVAEVKDPDVNRGEGGGGRRGKTRMWLNGGEGEGEDPDVNGRERPGC